MTPLPSLNAVGNAGFTDPEFIPSVPWLASLKKDPPSNFPYKMLSPRPKKRPFLLPFCGDV